MSAPSPDRAAGLSRWPWVVVVLVVTVAGGLVLAWSLTRPGTDPATPAASPGVATSDGQVVAGALAGLGTDPQSLVARASQDLMGGADARLAIPEGTDVVVDPDSWASTGPESGTIVVTLVPPGEGASTYLAAVLLEQGTWKVLGTILLAQPGADAEPSVLDADPSNGSDQ